MRESDILWDCAHARAHVQSCVQDHSNNGTNGSLSLAAKAMSWILHQKKDGVGEGGSGATSILSWGNNSVAEPSFISSLKDSLSLSRGPHPGAGANASAGIEEWEGESVEAMANRTRHRFSNRTHLVNRTIAGIT